MDTDHQTRPRGCARHACVLARAVWAPLAGVLASAVLVVTPGCNTPPADAQQEAASATATVVPTGRLREFSVTAYCTGTVTQSGARVKAGMAAADPRVLPVGSTVRVDGQGRAYDGIYTVTDTGREIKGRELDLYLDDCAEAQQFGRRTMRVAVIRRGWDPAATPGSPEMTQRR